MVKGLVIKNTGSWYTVKTDDGQVVDCKVKGNFRLKGIRSTNPVAVGDRVTIAEGKGHVLLFRVLKPKIRGYEGAKVPSYLLSISGLRQSRIVRTILSVSRRTCRNKVISSQPMLIRLFSLLPSTIQKHPSRLSIASWLRQKPIAYQLSSFSTRPICFLKMSCVISA